LIDLLLDDLHEDLIFGVGLRLWLNRMVKAEHLTSNLVPRNSLFEAICLSKDACFRDYIQLVQTMTLLQVATALLTTLLLLDTQRVLKKCLHVLLATCARPLSIRHGHLLLVLLLAALLDLLDVSDLVWWSPYRAILLGV
jgi:hypothetical protein